MASLHYNMNVMHTRDFGRLGFLKTYMNILTLTSYQNQDILNLVSLLNSACFPLWSMLSVSHIGFWLMKHQNEMFVGNFCLYHLIHYSLIWMN